VEKPIGIFEVENGTTVFEVEKMNLQYLKKKKRDQQYSKQKKHT
jgi:hypothetical protein